MKKVLVEFFDLENLNNCISQLHEIFDRIVYLYFETDKNPQTELLFKSLADFNRVRAGVTAEFIAVKNKSVEEITGKLSLLVNDEDSFIFDITGGPELFTMSAGVFFAQRNAGNISIHQYDVTSGRLTVSYPEEPLPPQRDYRLSVRELLRLHGSAALEGTVRYDLGRDGLEDNIIRMWNSVKKIKTEWNSFCSLPNFSEKQIQGTVYYKRIGSSSDERIYKTVTDALLSKKLITLMPSKRVDGFLYYSFISKMPRNADILFEKGGNLLEMLTYLAIKKSDDYADAMVGVPVDWDGIITFEKGETRNEIDVIASNGKIPIFISCKNTTVIDDYFYELRNMAAHYGGIFSRCILVSSVKNEISIHKRAEAMDIRLIDGINDKKVEVFFKEIKSAYDG